MKYLTSILVLLCAALPCLPADDLTWVKVDDVVYGAMPDDQGPIGGGHGYANVVTGGDYTVENLEELLDALSKAKAGEIIFIGGETVIDLTARIYIDEIVKSSPTLPRVA